MVRNLRYFLIVLTVIVFATMSAIFIKASVVVVTNSLKNPFYENTEQFIKYAQKMNLIISIPAVLTVLLLVLCLHLRDVEVKLAGYFIAVTLALSLVALVMKDGKTSIGVISILSFAYQVWLLLKLIFTGNVVFSEKEFRVQKAGSLLLHAGFSLLLLSWVTLSKTEFEIPVFYISTAFISLGMLLSFLPLKSKS